MNFSAMQLHEFVDATRNEHAVCSTSFFNFLFIEDRRHAVANACPAVERTNKEASHGQTNEPANKHASQGQILAQSGATFSTKFLNTIDRLWEGYHESGRCSRDAFPESYITKYATYIKIKPPPPHSLQGYLARSKHPPPGTLQ